MKLCSHTVVCLYSRLQQGPGLLEMLYSHNSSSLRTCLYSSFRALQPCHGRLKINWGVSHDIPQLTSITRENTVCSGITTISSIEIESHPGCDIIPLTDNLTSLQYILISILNGEHWWFILQPGWAWLQRVMGLLSKLDNDLKDKRSFKGFWKL